MIRKITRSLSARLLAIFFVTSAVYGVAGRYAVEVVRDTDYLREVVGAHVSLYADLVLREIGVPPEPSRAQAIVDRIPVDIRLSGRGVEWSSDPRFPELKEIPLQPISFFEFDERSRRELEAWARSLERVRFAKYKGHFYAELKHHGYVIVFASPKVAEEPPADLTGPAITLISLVVLLGCYFSVRWLIRPIKWIQAGAARIGQGDLDYRIRTSRRDDLGQLAVDINHMADDVRDMLEAKRQLLLAISHELRSPLTRAKVALEFLEDERVKQDVLDDLREMEQLIAELLESERMHTGHTTLQRSPFDLRHMLESLITEEFADRAGQIRLRLPAEPVVREADQVRLRLVARNLLDNALRYAPPDTPVDVELQVRPGMVVLTVRDYGPGIASEHLAKIAQPFYRADPARSRSTGGTGLGLYLAKRIAEAHRGTLTIDSEPERGVLVTVTIPDFVTARAA